MTQDNSASILYIEHNDKEAEYWQQRLTESGYSVDIAGTQREALRSLRTYSYDLVVLNQQVPGSTCIEILNMLADHQITSPVIMVAPHSDPEVTHRIYESGVRHYIIQDKDKHYVNQLPAAIQQTLEQERLLRALEKEKAKTQRLNRDLMLLNRVSQLLTSTFDLTKVCNQLVTTIAKIINAEGSAVWLLESAEAKSLHCISAYSAGRIIPPGQLRLPVTEGIAGWVATSGESLFIADVNQDERFSRRADNTLNFKTRSLATVPLKSRNNILGVLQIVNIPPGGEMDNERELIETLASSAAIAIQNAYLVEELREQNRELELQNADLEAYSGTVAHDLKNPITHFLSYADDLRERFQEMTIREIETHLDTILIQSRRMNLIIEELLLLARVRMTDEIPVDELEMADVVSGVLRQLQYDIREAGATVCVPDTWPNALGYAPWVESIWYNYLTNGLKYGGTPPKLELGGFVSNDGMAHYWIEDRGNGLTEVEQGELFSPFPKLKRVQQEGHGLGLVIVKRIAEKLGGSVDVKSTPGRGSRFYFSLPHWPDAEKSSELVTPKHSFEGGEAL